MILQLNPQIELNTQKGHGYANFLIDRGMEFDIEWIVFLDSGEIWSFQNRDVRLEKNITYGRTLEKKETQSTYEYLKSLPDEKLGPWKLEDKFEDACK